MDKSEFYDFMLSVIMDMERQGRYSTAHVYSVSYTHLSLPTNREV